MHLNFAKKDANFSFNVDYSYSGVVEPISGCDIGQEKMATRRRSAKTVAQRRRMKLHNRKDDIPDCVTLEEIDFDGRNLDLTLTSDQKSEKNANNDEICVSAENTNSTYPNTPHDVHTPLRSVNNGDETAVSMTSDNASDAENYKSCSSTYRSSRADGSNGNSASFTSRTGKKRRKRKRRPKSSVAVKFVSHLFENVGLAVTEFCLFAMKNFRDNDCGVVHKPTAGLMILVAIYFVIMYLEVSLAGISHMLMEFIWPGIHIVLRMFERFFSSIAGFFSNLDDIGESSYCDVAQVWCDYFHLMCENRCSFTKFALDRLRR